MVQITVSDATDLLAKLEALTASPPDIIYQDDGLRRRLREAGKNLSVAMETPGDTIHRIGNSSLQVYMARVGRDAKIFQIIASSELPLGCVELAQRSGLDPVLLKRLLRYYQSMRMIVEIAEDEYLANNVTRALAAPLGEGIVFFTTVLNPTFAALPEYLKSHGYNNPTNPCDSPWQAAYDTTDHAFVWLNNHPEHYGLFLMWMAMNREGLPLWHDVFPFEEQVGQHTTDETILFVDVGSALGHQSIELKEKFPNISGRVIIQDTPHVISTVKASHSIEPMAYDFFTPQPVKGSRVYYLRMILHDHEDDQCRQILQNTISAMTEDSVILIDDMMLPERGASWRATQLDITMMTCLAAKERSRNEWYSLLESAGLKVVNVWKYTEECDDCIIVAKPTGFS